MSSMADKPSTVCTVCGASPATITGTGARTYCCDRCAQVDATPATRIADGRRAIGAWAIAEARSAARLCALMSGDGDSAAAGDGETVRVPEGDAAERCAAEEILISVSERLAGSTSAFSMLDPMAQGIATAHIAELLGLASLAAREIARAEAKEKMRCDAAARYAVTMDAACAAPVEGPASVGGPAGDYGGVAADSAVRAMTDASVSAADGAVGWGVGCSSGHRGGSGIGVAWAGKSRRTETRGSADGDAVSAPASDDDDDDGDDGAEVEKKTRKKKTAGKKTKSWIDKLPTAKQVSRVIDSAAKLAPKLAKYAPIVAKYAPALLLSDAAAAQVECAIGGIYEEMSSVWSSFKASAATALHGALSGATGDAQATAIEKCSEAIAQFSDAKTQLELSHRTFSAAREKRDAFGTIAYGLDTGNVDFDAAEAIGDAIVEIDVLCASAREVRDGAGAALAERREYGATTSTTAGVGADQLFHEIAEKLDRAMPEARECSWSPAAIAADSHAMSVVVSEVKQARAFAEKAVASLETGAKHMREASPAMLGADAVAERAERAAESARLDILEPLATVERAAVDAKRERFGEGSRAGTANADAAASAPTAAAAVASDGTGGGGSAAAEKPDKASLLIYARLSAKRYANKLARDYDRHMEGDWSSRLPPTRRGAFKRAFADAKRLAGEVVDATAHAAELETSTRAARLAEFPAYYKLRKTIDDMHVQRTDSFPLQYQSIAADELQRQLYAVADGMKATAAYLDQAGYAFAGRVAAACARFCWTLLIDALRDGIYPPYDLGPLSDVGGGERDAGACASDAAAVGADAGERRDPVPKAERSRGPRPRAYRGTEDSRRIMRGAIDLVEDARNRLHAAHSKYRAARTGAAETRRAQFDKAIADATELLAESVNALQRANDDAIPTGRDALPAFRAFFRLQESLCGRQGPTEPRADPVTAQQASMENALFSAAYILHLAAARAAAAGWDVGIHIAIVESAERFCSSLAVDALRGAA